MDQEQAKEEIYSYSGNNVHACLQCLYVHFMAQKSFTFPDESNIFIPFFKKRLHFTHCAFFTTKFLTFPSGESYTLPVSYDNLCYNPDYKWHLAEKRCYLRPICTNAQKMYD